MNAGPLKLGRPANRKHTYRGDRRGMVADGQLMGADAHGVYWRPLREYYDQNADTTLVIFAPVHPEQLPAALR